MPVSLEEQHMLADLSQRFLTCTKALTEAFQLGGGDPPEGQQRPQDLRTPLASQVLGQPAGGATCDKE